MSVWADIEGVRTDLSDLRRSAQLTDEEATIVHALEALAGVVESVARWAASLDSRTERLA